MCLKARFASPARCKQHQLDSWRNLAEASRPDRAGLTRIKRPRQGGFAPPADVPCSHPGAMPGEAGIVRHSADEERLNVFNVHRMHTCQCHLCLLYQVPAPAAQFKRHKGFRRRPFGGWHRRSPRQGTLTLFALDWAPPAAQSLGNFGKGGL